MDQPAIESTEKTLTLAEYLIAISKDLDVADDENPPENSQLRLIASELRGLAERGIEVGIYVEGGLVQGVRSNVPMSVFVTDADVFDCCAGKIEDKSYDKDGQRIVYIKAECAPDEDEADREDHAAHREKYKDYLNLPVEVH